jgi:NADPH-dependent F420 reductase
MGVIVFKIAVIGGTGPQGKGLAYRFVKHGHSVVLGSRAAERATEAADEIAARVPGASVSGATNDDALAAADIVLLAVPYQGHDELVTALAAALAGKTVISCVNPLGFDKGGPHGLVVPGGSAAETAQSIVPDATFVGAFHHVSAVSLWGDDEYLSHEDVLVCGDDAEAKQVAIELAASVTGRPGIDAGKLRLAAQLEPFTAVLISINKKYKVQSGLLIGGLEH